MAHIDTPARIGAFLAQVGHESNKFRAFTEYASGSEYEGRGDLGNLIPGDGVRFKGRGAIQVTGRNNYLALSHWAGLGIELVDHPEKVAEPDMAFLSAAWYWETRNINAICDQPEPWTHPGPHQYTKFQWITILVNGGLNGWVERLGYYRNAKKVLSF